MFEELFEYFNWVMKSDFREARRMNKEKGREWERMRKRERKTKIKRERGRDRLEERERKKYKNELNRFFQKKRSRTKQKKTRKSTTDWVWCSSWIVDLLSTFHCIAVAIFMSLRCEYVEKPTGKKNSQIKHFSVSSSLIKGALCSILCLHVAKLNNIKLCVASTPLTISLRNFGHDYFSLSFSSFFPVYSWLPFRRSNEKKREELYVSIKISRHMLTKHVHDSHVLHMGAIDRKQFQCTGFLYLIFPFFQYVYSFVILFSTLYLIVDIIK